MILNDDTIVESPYNLLVQEENLISCSALLVSCPKNKIGRNYLEYIAAAVLFKVFQFVTVSFFMLAFSTACYSEAL